MTYAGFRVRIVPDSYFPQEHYADAVHFPRFHPLVRWFCRKLGRQEGWTLQGRPLFRPKEEAYQMGDTLFCTARIAKELERVTSESVH